MSQPTVFVVEDDDAVRESMVWMLEQQGIRVAAFAAPSELLAAYDATTPGCLVLDLRLPEMSGIELRRRIVASGCQHPFIMISGHGEVRHATDAMRMGAVDFIEKPIDRDRFLERVWEAIDLDKRQRSDEAQWAHVQSRLDSLTRREREVLEYVVAGQLTKQIASRLGISTKTVEVHRSNIMKKMNAESVAQLVRVVTQHSAS